MKNISKTIDSFFKENFNIKIFKQLTAYQTHICQPDEVILKVLEEISQVKNMDDSQYLQFELKDNGWVKEPTHVTDKNGKSVFIKMADHVFSIFSSLYENLDDYHKKTNAHRFKNDWILLIFDGGFNVLVDKTSHFKIIINPDFKYVQFTWLNDLCINYDFKFNKMTIAKKINSIRNHCTPHHLISLTEKQKNKVSFKDIKILSSVSNGKKVTMVLKGE